MKSTQPFELINTVINQSGLPASGFSRLWFRADYLVHQTIGGVIRDVTLDRPLSPLNIAAVASPILQGDTVLEAFQKIQGSLNNIEIVGDVVGAGVYNNDKIEITVTGFGPGAGVDLQDTLDNDPIASIAANMEITRTGGATWTTSLKLLDDGLEIRQINGSNNAEMVVQNGSANLTTQNAGLTNSISANTGSVTFKHLNATGEKSLEFDSSSMRVKDSTTSLKGLVYAGNYDSNGILDDNWIPSYRAVKAYTDSQIATVGLQEVITTGSTYSGSDIVSINTSGTNIVFSAGAGGNTASVSVSNNGTASLSGEAMPGTGLGQWVAAPTGLTATYTDGSSGDATDLVIDGTSARLTDNINSKGFVYGGNYDTNGTLDDNWLPSWRAVKNYADLAANSAYVASGVIEQGLGWTNNANGTITLPTIDVVLNTQSDFGGVFNKYTLTGGTTGTEFTSLTDGDTNYIYIDYNSGTPQWVITTAQPDYADGDKAKYATIYRAGSNLHIVDWDSEASGLANKLLEKSIETRMFEKASGLNISLGGNDPLQLNISAGVVWNGVKRTVTSNINSWDNVFFSNYHSGGSWSVTVSGVGSGTLNNTHYDDGTNLVALTSNNYVVNWIYKGVESAPHVYQVIGRNQYSTIAHAQEETPPALPELVSSHAILVGRVICQQGSTVGIVEEAIDISFVSSAAANLHNELTSIQGGLANEYYHLTSAQHTIATQAATGSLDGYLTSADWTTFNNKVDKASGLLNTWTLDTGTVYYQDFNHNLNTEDIIVEIYDATTKETVLPEAVDRTNANTVRIKVIGNSTNYRITVVG